MGSGASADVSASIAKASQEELKAAINALPPDMKAKLKDALSKPPKNMEWIAAGYCPVSYFNPDHPAHKGSDAPDAQAEFEGATYKLTNADVVKMFLDGPPPNFLPQYGGFCATAMSMGVQGPVSPDQYRVVDKKLYLFHTAEAKAAFEKDESGMIKAADEKWSSGKYGPPPASKTPPKNMEWIAAGYCPVSYFNPDHPAHKGSDAPDAQAEFEGATYKLTNADVVKMFLDGPPPNFLPQYGGFCATAMSMGVQGPVSPDQYRVVDKKLYLFHTAEAKAAFEKDESGMIKAADEKWSSGKYGPPS
eukprot:TRINITY_DN20223_c0_g1_i1.p1 TRINITY_DN20223_c0_g1~~TRINITY_DN20223_c0_g1_i1.p1  ORF type:complete len:305 (+),score=61.93 TRINITY_DN20223_c0_g1_i1:73-987(+)